MATFICVLVFTLITAVGFLNSWSIQTWSNWEGVFVCAAALTLLNLNVLTKGRAFQFLNLAAGIGIMAGAWEKGNWAIVGLETIWSIVSIIGWLFPPVNDAYKKKGKVLITILTLFLIVTALLSMASNGLGFIRQMTTLTQVGWIGAILCVLDLALLNAGTISEGRLYQAINTLAGICLIAGASEYRNWPVMALELYWILVSIYGLIRPPNGNECKNSSPA